MKSFSGDEGYQALCSPCLIEQESYIANYVVCIPLVSTVLSGGVHSAAVQKRQKNTDVGVNNSLLLSRYFHTCLARWGFFCFSCFFGQEPACSRHSSDLNKTLTRDLMEFSAPLKRTEKRKSLHLGHFAFEHIVASLRSLFLYNVYKWNCEPLRLFAAIIVNHLPRIALSLSSRVQRGFFLFSLFLLASLLANHGMKFCCLAMLGKLLRSVVA